MICTRVGNITSKHMMDVVLYWGGGDNTSGERDDMNAGPVLRPAPELTMCKAPEAQEHD